MIKIGKPWWMTDDYSIEEPIPLELEANSGPHDLALVKAWPSGATSSGWALQYPDGSPGFMENYSKNHFAPRRALNGYDKNEWAFAFIMRSINVIAIDIDGKNGGLEHASELLMGAPPTLAETSKSGTGYHLLYRTDDTWDSAVGFGEFVDVIGIVQGVDIRAVGCLYHHPQQRWNGRELAPLPKHIAQRLHERQLKRRNQTENIKKVLSTNDMEEILIMHDNLLDDLAKPIPAGKRNITLFAIGHKLREAEVSDWQDKLAARAADVGLPQDEIDKLVRNIEKYTA